MNKIALSVVFLIMLSLTLTAGCSDYGSPSAPVEATATIAATSSQQSGFSLVPTPNDKMPSGHEVGAKAFKDPINAMLNVEFTGGAGLYMVDSVITTVYLSDGSIVTDSIEPQMGGDVEIQGTKGEDRVTVTVNMVDGQSYKIFDEIVTYRDK